MNPKISIIVPIYNVEKYLQQSLTSICNQTLEEIEIICINDGSKDTSLKILNYFAKKDSRIRIVSTVNSGYGHAMNLGLKLSKGEYIGIVEPDDYIDKYMYEHLYDAAKINDVDIVKADFKRFKTPLNSEMETLYQSVVDNQLDYNKVIVPKYNKVIFRYIVNIWCGIYRREFIISNNISFNESKGAAFQDNGFWFQTLCHCNGIYYVQIPFYMNRRDNISSSVNRVDNLYAGNSEFEFIYKLMNNSPELKENFIDGYHIKKYQTYKFNLDRCPDYLKKEYIECISKEWKNDMEKGELTKGIFKDEEWNEILQIIDEPIKYINRTVGGEDYNEILLQDKYNSKRKLKKNRISFLYRIDMFNTKLYNKIKKYKERKNV